MSAKASLALGSLLAQVRPADTANLNAFTATLDTEVMLITVANTSGGAASCRIFHDDDAAIFDESTALFWDFPVAVDAPVIFQARAEGSGIQLVIGASMAVRSSVANALTFSIYGATETLAERIRG
jgi:hypothetical protein